jgi:carbon storage regulator CsrA
MLVLTRRHQQQIRIGDNITITVLRVQGNAVRVGIQAPRDIRVIRGELPTFELPETTELPMETAESDSAGEEVADEEPTVSDLQWRALRKLRVGRRPCLPVRGRKARSGTPGRVHPEFETTVTRTE